MSPEPSSRLGGTLPLPNRLEEHLSPWGAKEGSEARPPLTFPAGTDQALPGSMATADKDGDTVHVRSHRWAGHTPGSRAMLWLRTALDHGPAPARTKTSGSENLGSYSLI